MHVGLSGPHCSGAGVAARHGAGACPVVAGSDSYCRTRRDASEADIDKVVVKQPALLTRRQQLATVAFGGLAVPLACGHTLTAQAEPLDQQPIAVPSLADGLPTPSAQPRPANNIDAQLAASFTEAVYTAFAELKVVPDAEFQAQVFKLRQREYRYYAEAVNSNLAGGNVPEPSEAAPVPGTLPLVPDLSDQGGLLNNALYFNFVLYILWKAALSYVKLPEQRKALVDKAGAILANLAIPVCLQRAEQAATRGAGRCSPQELLDCVQGALDYLQAAGYLQAYQVLWGYPGPLDSNTSAEMEGGSRVGGPGPWTLQAEGTGSSEGSGGVPLQLLQPDSKGNLHPPTGAVAEAGTGQGIRLQVRLRAPADAAGVVALQEEEDGFSGALVGPLLRTVVTAAGFPSSIVTETIQQDVWLGSEGLGQRMFFSMVDPVYLTPLLQTTPSSSGELTVVQNWAIM